MVNEFWTLNVFRVRGENENLIFQFRNCEENDALYDENKQIRLCIFSGDVEIPFTSLHDLIIP